MFAGLVSGVQEMMGAFAVGRLSPNFMLTTASSANLSVFSPSVKFATSGSGVVRAVYTHGKEKIVGLFAIGSGPVGADTGLPDGPYRDEYSGKDIYIYHGAVPIGEDPVILSLGN